ncbi:MAG: glycosyltransferase family 2 protein [Flavobacteriales bacterium]|nr:glycosyltransferase family 2 protein [Flavobacteriales bacterium]
MTGDTKDTPEGTDSRRSSPARLLSTTAMQGFSAVIITFNEERNIGRCIASVQGLADEVIVVDSESTDRTLAIAEELGARVLVRKWTDYSDQKNFANQQASQAYIFRSMPMRRFRQP